MTDEQNPAPMPGPDPMPSSDPPPLAPYVQQSSAASTPEPMTETAAMPVAPVATPMAAAPVAPPPVAWGAPPVVVAAKGGRTTLAAVAGVALIILGVLGALLGLAFAVLGASIVKQVDLSQYGDFGNVNDPAAIVSGAIAFIGIIVVVYSLMYLIGGIGIVRSRGWGRVIGLIVGILSGIFWLLSLTGGGSASGSLAVPLVMVAIHAYVVVVLIMFWRSRAA